MHEDVQPHFFLEAYDARDLGFQEAVVFRSAQAPGFERGAGLPHRAGLRERSDRGRGERGQP